MRVKDNYGFKTYPLPGEVLKWLKGLPEPARTRETLIAERNWARICRFMEK